MGGEREKRGKRQWTSSEGRARGMCGGGRQRRRSEGIEGEWTQRMRGWERVRA